MKLSVSAYRAHASAHKKILDTSYNQYYGSTSASHLHPSSSNAGPSGFQVSFIWKWWVTAKFSVSIIDLVNVKQRVKLLFNSYTKSKVSELFPTDINLAVAFFFIKKSKEK